MHCWFAPNSNFTLQVGIEHTAEVMDEICSFCEVPVNGSDALVFITCTFAKKNN